jgi:hypothetical protein
MTKLDRRDRVSIAAGVLLLLGMLVVAVSLLVMFPLTAVAGVAIIGSGACILAGQRRSSPQRATR